MTNSRKTYLVKICNILSWIFLLSVLAFLTLYLNYKMDYMLDSDMSSEMVLSKMLAESNKLITSRWGYSTEIRVISSQLFFSFLFKITDNWHAVRIIGTMVAIIYMLLAYYYLCSQLKIKQYFALTATFLILPFSIDWFHFVEYGAFYSPLIAISFITLALVINIDSEASIKRKKILTLLLVVVSFLSGLSGPRQIMLLQLPLLIIVLISRLRYKESKYLKASLISFIAVTVGYIVNNALLIFKILRGYHFAARHFNRFSLDIVSDVIAYVLEEFGYSTGLIASLSLISSAVAIGLLFSLIAMIIFSLKTCKKDSYSVLISEYILASLTVLICVSIFINMGYTTRYVIPIVAFTFPLLALTLNELNIKYGYEIAICCFCLFAMILTSANTIYGYRNTDISKQYREIVQVLQKADCSNGYATFWNGNVLTELSNGEIEVWLWNGVENENDCREQGDIDDLHPILQNLDHENTKPDGRIFVLLNNMEYENIQFAKALIETRPYYQSDNYRLFIFDDISEFNKVLNQTNGGN